MRLSKFYLYIISALTGIAVGACIALLVFPGTPLETTTRPGILRAPEISDEFPVTPQEFDDAVQAELHVTIRDLAPVIAHHSGTITQWDCAVGRSLESGKSPLRIDDKPVLALGTRVPFWRDIAVGDVGEDVSALKEELSRLGYEQQQTPEFTAQDMENLSRLATEAGVTLQSTLNLEDVVWFPATGGVIQSCDSVVGTAVVAGDVIARTETGLTVSGIELPADALPGTRVIDIAGSEVTLSATESVPADIPQDQLRKSEQYLTARASEPDASELTLHFSARLAEPVEATAVPATAILSDQGGKQCVASNGRPFPVRVVGSQLGNTYVIFDEETPTEIDLASSEKLESCG